MATKRNVSPPHVSQSLESIPAWRMPAHSPAQPQEVTMDTVRYNPDVRLGELEHALWELQSQLDRAQTPLQKRIAQTAIERVRRAFEAKASAR